MVLHPAPMCRAVSVAQWMGLESEGGNGLGFVTAWWLHFRWASVKRVVARLHKTFFFVLYHCRNTALCQTWNKNTNNLMHSRLLFGHYLGHSCLHARSFLYFLLLFPYSASYFQSYHNWLSKEPRPFSFGIKTFRQIIRLNSLIWADSSMEYLILRHWRKMFCLFSFVLCHYWAFL